MNNISSVATKLRAVSYILVAEDDLDDQELIRDALTENNLTLDKIKFAQDGEELISVLNSAEVLPNLILLDLNMPRKSGREALAEIKQDPRLKHIPVIIFTTSDSEIDIKECYFLGSNAYLTKPNNYFALVALMKDLINFWFCQAQMVID
ncbi:response regulator [Aliiglaciecola lipolytica]|uniref:response regulator n=1 Tax=Aliiglaciecola lipolytica TaxID=477689 RepID=UPI001C0A543D|nr:response regulator [Aliiglaciecola lipolytica]MBU2877957.1 response regulator [Aliiglaciecola lipolytica]